MSLLALKPTSKSQSALPKAKSKWSRYVEPKKKKSYFTKKSVSKRNEGAVKKEKVGLINYFFDFTFNVDKRIFFAFLGLLLVGIVAVYSSTVVFSYRFGNGNGFYYVSRHLQYVIAGSLVLAIFFFVRPEVLARFWYIFLSASVLLLTYILIMSLVGKAESVNGATRWVNFFDRSFQPSDIAKLAFMIFVAAFLSTRRKVYESFKDYFAHNLAPFGIWFGLIMILILAGKNLGTTMVIGFIGIMCYGVSVTSKYHKWGLFLMIGVMILGGGIFALVEGYRMDRVSVWFNYLKTNDFYIEQNGVIVKDPRAYQFEQGVTSLGAGGLTGKGIGQSIGKFYFVQTSAGDDSIVAIMGEEMGFIVLSLILLLYLYMIHTCLSISKNFIDRPIHLYLMVAACSWIGFQMFVHVGANIGVVPLTGQTMPFISLGGSSLISLMAAMGIILNVSKQKDHIVSKEAFITERFEPIHKPTYQSAPSF